MDYQCFKQRWKKRKRRRKAKVVERWTEEVAETFGAGWEKMEDGKATVGPAAGEGPRIAVDGPGGREGPRIAVVGPGAGEGLTIGAVRLGAFGPGAREGPRIATVGPSAGEDPWITATGEEPWRAAAGEGPRIGAVGLAAREEPWIVAEGVGRNGCSLCAARVGEEERRQHFVANHLPQNFYGASVTMVEAAMCWLSRHAVSWLATTPASVTTVLGLFGICHTPGLLRGEVWTNFSLEESDFFRKLGHHWRCFVPEQEPWVLTPPSFLALVCHWSILEQILGCVNPDIQRRFRQLNMCAPHAQLLEGTVRGQEARVGDLMVALAGSEMEAALPSVGEKRRRVVVGAVSVLLNTIGDKLKALSDVGQHEKKAKLSEAAEAQAPQRKWQTVQQGKRPKYCKEPKNPGKALSRVSVVPPGVRGSPQTRCPALQQIQAQAEEQFEGACEHFHRGTLGWSHLWFASSRHLRALTSEQQGLVAWWRKVLAQEGAPIGESVHGPKGTTSRVPKFCLLLDSCKPLPQPHGVAEEVAFPEVAKLKPRGGKTEEEEEKIVPPEGGVKPQAEGLTVDTVSEGAQAVVLAMVSVQGLQEDQGASDPDNLAVTNLEQLLDLTAGIQEEAPRN